MAVVRFRNIYAARWLGYVQAVVKALDDGRAVLAAHSSHLVHERPASSLLSTAQTAVFKLMAALSRRAGVFRVEHSVMHGSVWDQTRDDYIGACGELWMVSEALRFSIAVLLFDERSSGLLENVSIIHETRAYLELGHEQIAVKTRSVLDAAEHFMLYGGCSDLPGLPIDIAI